MITGGNKGLGLETGRQLAQQGFLVVLGSRDIDADRAAAASLRALGPGTEAVQLDVTDETSIAHARDQLTNLTGRLDVLINNAGIIIEALATEITAAQLRPVFETNLFGAASVTSAMLGLLASAPIPASSTSPVRPPRSP